MEEAGYTGGGGTLMPGLSCPSPRDLLFTRHSARILLYSPNVEEGRRSPNLALGSRRWHHACGGKG
jgi:hypothetical protein